MGEKTTKVNDFLRRNFMAQIKGSDSATNFNATFPEKLVELLATASKQSPPPADRISRFLAAWQRWLAAERRRKQASDTSRLLSESKLIRA